MAKVISLLQLRGSIDDLTFRKTEDGTIAGMKPGPTRERVLTHENFKRTRRNAAEFQEAIQDARLLRHALGQALNGRRGSSMNGRMNGLFYSAARQDSVSDLGARRASQGPIDLLRGFDFNKELSLEHALPVPLMHQLDVATGACQVKIPSFIARKRKGFPPEATHFRIISGLALVDFLCPSYRHDVQESELLPLRAKTPEGICFEHRLEPGEGKVMVQVLGMEFYKLVNGKEVLIKGSAVRILEAVRVEGETTGTSTQLHKAGLHTRASERLVEEGNETSRQQGNEGGEKTQNENGLLRTEIEDELQKWEGKLVCEDTNQCEGRRQGVEEGNGITDRQKQEEDAIVGDIDSCYGVLRDDNHIERAPYVGSAKVLEVG